MSYLGVVVFVCVQWCPTHIVLIFFLRLVFPMLQVFFWIVHFGLPLVFSSVSVIINRVQGYWGGGGGYKV